MSDPRLPWLASALSGLGSSGAAVPSGAALASEPAVSAWLAGAPEAKLLSAYVLSAERDPARSVRFTNEVGALAQAGAEDAPAAEVHLIRLDGGAAAAASAPEGAPAAQQSAEEFSKQVLVTNTGGNAVLGLYELIHSVFAPKLLGGSDSTLASKLQREVSGLESKLHMLSLLGSGKPAPGAGVVQQNPELDVSQIKSVADEVDYWSALKETAGGHAAVRAQDFLDKLSSSDCELGVRWEWSALQNLKGDELSRLLDDTQYVLSELWLTVPDRGDAYPQQRMEHLLHLLTLALVQACKHSVRTSVALWTDPFPRVKEALSAAMALLNQWQHICDDLVANEFGSRWKRAPAAAAAAPVSPTGSAATQHAYTSPALTSLLDRLDEVLRLRSVHEELLHLLSAEDAHSFKLDSFFDAFRTGPGAVGVSIDALNVGPYAHAKWAGAVAELDRLLGPAETHASTLLKNRLYALADRPELLMQEFAQFAGLLRRPAVARALENERKTLLQQLSTRLDELKQNFESYSNEYSSSASSSTPPPLKNQPSVFLARIIWANQLSHRLGQILAIVSSVLAGIPGQDRFHSLASDLRRRIDSYARELFDRWHGDVRDSLADDNSPLRLETSGKLMGLDLGGSGALVVHYSSALVTLLREVRQLQEYGYKVHDSVVEAVQTGERYYRYGLELKRVANFYNTIREKIVPSQMAMLLLEAQRFEQVVKAQTGARWDRPEECERFLARLLATTEELTTRNTKLKSLHLTLAAQVSALFGPQFDLARNKEPFLEAVSRARGLIDREAARNSAPREAVALWRQHWNEQVFKVCNFQYQWLLETLNGDGSNAGSSSGASGSGSSAVAVAGGSGSGNNGAPGPSFSLPSFLDIPCELRFHHKKLQLRPALEDLRSSYYRTLKKFLDLPKNFLGVYEPTQAGTPPPGSIFASIPERNAPGLHALYVQAESLFAQLRSVQTRYEPWMALGSIDLEAYTSEKLSSVLDWEVNFKALRARRKESEKLPDVVRVGCFVVSLSAFKSALDDSMHRFQEALLVSLKKSTGASLKRVADFIDLAMTTLNAAPQSLSEMSAAKSGFDRIQADKPEMHRIMEGMYEKDALLRQMANVTLDLSAIAPGWSLFLDSYAKFDDLLLEQKESLRLGLENQIKESTLAVDKFASRWSATKPSTDGNMNVTAAVAARIIEEVADWQAQLQALREGCAEIQEHCSGFGMAVPPFEALDALEKEINGYADSWSLFTAYAGEVDKMVSEDWVAFRREISSFATLLDRWTNKLKQRGQRDAVFDYLAREIKTNRDLYPVLQLISADFLQNEHFKLLFSLLSFDHSVTIRTVNLGHFLQANALMLRKKNEIRSLVERAQGEVVIRESVENLRVWGDKTEFSLLEQSTSSPLGNTHVIREWKELFTQISDQQALVGSLKESPYFAPFADVAKQFEEKFVLLDEVLHALNLIQRKYLSLEPILSTGALPSESARFKRVDAEFRGIMKEVAENPNVLAMTNVPDLRSTVHSMLEQLERTQKALNDFLEEKRSKFPRFYFIGDDDLLEIIGQSENPLVIQNHLRKLFAGIATVEFSADQKKIVAMLSSERERVQLLAPVAVTPHVEEWLAALSSAMEATLAQLLLQCLKEFDIARFPSQILNLAESVHFTADAEAAIQKQGLPALHASLQARLKEYTSTDTSDDHEDSALLQSKIKALVMDLIHNIDVVRQLMDAKVTSLDNWVWQKQLRYVVRDGRAWIRMVDAEFAYTYEYLGNCEKLVHTPLSDKCYLVLTQGMHLGYGGCPFGPAGTGKTESVKALGHAFGRQVLVFNCDEGIDFQSMGRIFTGLVKSGAWGCFDEFNRLKEDQLSAVSQQIQVIQQAIKAKDAECDLLGKVISVNANAAIFVTMNPASREYGGRSKLPGSLKQLFRDISMALPDLGLIMQTILMAEGFAHAELLGRKVTEVFELSKQLLSQQRHYDWGLRAIKTVLRHAGQLIHTEKKKAAAAGAAAAGGALAVISQQTEASLLIGALKINTLSKLTYADSVRFNALINDVFPGAVDEDIDYGELTKNIRAALEELKLEAVDSQIKKILQLHAALHQRMGVVIVGPSGSGKSVMLNVLHTALGKMGQGVVRHVMNPKALERSKLLGRMDNDTREWTDGVLTAAARQVQREPTTTHTWIISDGDVDPEWIESLNSVLDDNHLLTMPNGERIKFGSNVNFVFETESLAHASPATVSRMGVIFLDEEETDIRSLVAAWLKRQDPSVQMRLAGWMEEMFYGALDWVLEAQADVVERTKIGVVLTGLSHLRNVGAKAEFCVGLIRGLGCNLPLDRRTQFATKVWSSSQSEKPLDSRAPLDCYWNKATNSLGAYALREAPIALESISFRAPPVVETVDVQRNRDLIMPWLQNMEPMILVGPDGCGRSLLLESCFRSLRHCTVATINCSAQTNASHVVQKLNDHCSVFSTNKGRVYRPKEGERLVLFLKDLNLPRPDKYDTIQLIAFLQQLVTYHGFYDDNLDWVGIDRGVQIVACMAPSTSVGRHALSTRFTASVHVAVMTYPERDQLVAIYTSFLKGVLAAAGAGSSGLPDPTWKSEGNVRKLCGTIIDIYDKVRSRFSVDDQRHYAFNPRDLTQWLFGLLRYDLPRENLLDVLVYEASRLFADRLVLPEQVKAFEAIVAALMSSHWKHAAKASDVYYTSLQQYSLDAAGSSGSDGGAGGEGAKADLSVLATELGASLDRVSAPQFKELCAEGLAVYQREYKDLQMQLFPEVMDHLAREERVLSRPGGSLFLVGDSGVGRRSSTTLVAHMLRMAFVSPNISRKYDAKAFRTDLKEYLRAAGVDGRQTLLYLEEHQLVAPEIVEDVNSLLSAGEVAGLYTPQETEAMLSPLKEAFAASGLYRSLGEFFTSRVRANLHVVLSMDPRHPLFAARCESNPALFTRCSILWMGRWSRASLAEIPREKLARMLSGAPPPMPAGGAAGGAGAVVPSSGGHHASIDANRVLETLLFIHSNALSRGLCATPLKYCAFVDTYARIFDRNQSGLVSQKKHLLAGLQKLTDAAGQVDVLSKDAQQKAAQVTTKQKEADQALEQITQRMGQASERKVEVEQLQKTLGGEEAKLNVRKEQIQNELRDIAPILEEARSAVGGIKKDNLNEIRAFRMPPAQIHAVLCGVLGLMRQEDTSWQNMKKFLGSPSVKEDILNFDVNAVDAATRTKVQGLMAQNPDAFDKAKMMRVNVAAAPLAAWVQACVRYSAVLETVKPLRDSFEAASRQLDGARTRVKQCEQELQQLDAEVQKLKERFGKTTAEAETLKLALARTTEILASAQLLLGKLSGERNRWEGQVKHLSTGLEALTYNAMLAAGFVSYLGGCPEDVRRDAVATWREKAGLDAFDFMGFMSSESELLQWKAEGLPSDNLSMENSLVILNSLQVPFIIDPSAACTGWLRAHLGDKTEVVMQQEGRFATALELAVRFGKTLIVQEADGLLPMLYPIVRRDLVGQGPRKMVQVGEKAVDYNEGFKLYLVTRDPAPDLTPTARAMVNEVNFTVTRSGLEGQLLGVTLAHEKPQLEQKKSELLAAEDQLKIQLAELEKRLLNELAESSGNILENKTLIESLNQTKTQSSEIAVSLASSKEIQSDLDRQREVYRPIAHVGSVLFFLVAQLSAVNNMYEFSLPSFIALFKQNLLSKDVPAAAAAAGSSGSSGAEGARVDGLSTTLRLKIFTFITRSLFKNDRLMFALHFVHCLKGHMFAEREWEFFTGQVVGEANSRDVPLPSWAAKDRAAPFASLVSTFPALVRSAKLGDEQAWGKWYKSGRPEVEFPAAAPGEKALTPFQRLLLVKTLRPDRLQTALTHFACEAIGVSTISPPPLNLQRIILEEGAPLTPVLFICEGGADPTQELEECAERSVGKANFHQVALGSGQTEGAMALVYRAAKEGHHLLLKNLHLVSPWLYDLEKTLKLLKPHPQFRLILTTEVSESFPTILLQESLLISYESPPGIKQNLLRTYEGWDAAYVSKGGATRAQLLFVLAWFHAVVQERRTYLPQGWTKFYEFSFADLRSGADIIDNLFAKLTAGRPAGTEIDPAAFPWLSVWGLLKFAIYGGRIDNDHDVRVLVTYLRKFFAKDILSAGGAPATRKLTGGLELPATNSHADYMRLINRLPDQDMPVLFSLPENVEGAVQETQSAAVVVQLRKLAVSGSSLAKFDRDVWRAQLTPLLQLWERYSTKDNKALLQRPPRLSKKEENYTPLEAFIVLENAKAFDLVQLVHAALSGLSAVVYSSGLLTADIASDGAALLAGQTPWRWARNWFGPSDPAAWITQISERKQTLLALLQRTDAGQLLSQPLILGQLFTPKVCLNALRQQTARQTGKAIDTLKLVASWDPALLANAPLRVTLDGLMLQGCGFQGGVLSPLSPDSPSLVHLPPATIAYISKEEGEPYPDAQGALPVPVYVATSREEYVCEIRVPCKGQLDRWILAGAALCLNAF